LPLGTPSNGEQSDGKGDEPENGPEAPGGSQIHGPAG